MKVSAVIPAYNESSRIGAVIERARAYVDEVVVVDDGSTDDTAGVSARCGAFVITQESNSGYLAAVRRGMAEASGDVVVTLDADGELPPEAIPHLIAPIAAGVADMVQGARPRVVRPSENLLNWIAGLVADVGDSGTGMRAIRSELTGSLDLGGACICAVTTLDFLAKGGRVADVPIDLRSVDKARKPAWFHWRQLAHLIMWIWRTRAGRRRPADPVSGPR